MARRVLPALLFLLIGSSGVGTFEARADSLYVIDGFVLGEQADPGRDYRCEPAKQPSDFTWCERTRQERSRRGNFRSTISILSDKNGDSVYVNRLIEPAFFGSKDIASEIARLSARFGERARETRLPSREDVPTGVIAVWGKLELQPLDAAALAALDADKISAQDLLVDPLGDIKRSRELGLPVYRLGGGAGYLWSAAHTKGRGHLRFLTADPSALVAKPAAPSAKAAPKTLASVEPKFVQQTFSQTSFVQPTVALAGTAAAIPAPDHSSSVPINTTVRAKSVPDHAVAVPPRNELELATLESERLAPEHTGSIATVPAHTAAEAPAAPSVHRLESILALAGLAAVLLFFLASLIERLVREPTGLELLELERQRELAAELAELRAMPVIAGDVQPEIRFAGLRRIAAGIGNFADLAGSAKSVVLRFPALARRA
jgi:hypothetical protein